MDLRAELLKKLGINEFVVVDLETTGLVPEEDEIIEIGAIKFVNGVEKETFETLVNPGRPIPEFITRLTGIKDEDVASAPKIEDVFDKLDHFLKDIPFVGHQVNFDASFIEYMYRRQNKDFDQWQDQLNRFKYFGRVRIDTLFLSRILLPFLPKLKLGYLAQYFGHDLENAHRAIDDARATGQIFLELLDRALALDNNVISEIIQLLFANSVRAKSFFVPLLKFKTENNISVPSVSIIDDIKHAQDYYNVIGEKEYRFSPSDEEQDFNEIEARVITDYFKNDGDLAGTLENYELREEQLHMAERITDAVNTNAFIVSEAGTGTGKSMAYLTPSVEWAVRNRSMHERVVVSTNTKNLQEQLFFKDLPTLFQARKGNFKAVLLKGRSNYLCLDKWKTVMTDMNQRLSQDERARILPLVLWVRQTRTGDIAENSAFQLEANRGIWQKFIAEPSYCPGKACKFYNDCFLMKARDNARKADLVVVNHALLFSDLASDHSILGEFNNLIIDEAHNIEKSAAEHLGVRVSFWTFRNIYHRLYEEDPKKTGAVLQLEFRMSKGILTDQETSDLYKHINGIKSNSMRLKLNVQQFYNEFNRYMRSQIAKNANQTTDSQKIRYYKNFKFFRESEDQIAEIKKTLGYLSKQLNELSDYFYDLDENRFEFQDQIHREFLALAQDIMELQEAFDFCVLAEENKYVYWFEVPFNERNTDVLMNAVPLQIADILKDRLFQNLRSLVMTSATLSVDKKFDYFKQRVGLSVLHDREVHTQIHGSPFNFNQQIFLAVTDFMPDPRNQLFSQELIELIRDIHSAEHKGLMVLFTSYSLLNMVYNILKPHFEAEKILLLAQGKSGSRTNIINQFKENTDSVLLGTDSFWEGVDVPGNALQILMIPKLPFDVPTDPLIAARMEQIKERGGNPFFEYSVPEAIIKFRQGFGRLIRSKSDYGAVICCDNRLSRMQYGKQFLNSLPVEASVYFNKNKMIDEMHEWFRQKEEKTNDAIA
ncbi:MAG: 3'-5' exoribonuclease [Calditrichae bacterium]|nr:3'-5' exoribonuclease [Calditrichota bacterium]MCB9058498.1 3'-5' exoribonuclease [Calditrichia bacterium]